MAASTSSGSTPSGRAAQSGQATSEANASGESSLREVTQQLEFCAILDFGSQYSQLIARRVRENRVYCEILSFDTTAQSLKDRNVKAIILSGGPCGVYEEGAPDVDPAIFDLGIPVLGICYGMQIGCKALGGTVVPAAEREYGDTTLILEADHNELLLQGLDERLNVWMSHGDRVMEVGEHFNTLAHTQHSPYAIVRHKERPFYGLQFHPEVTHTKDEGKILNNFLYRICKFAGDWKLTDYISQTIADVRAKVGDARVVCGLSGGVDSAVVALLLHKAIGEKLTCIFVDNGLLRKGEAEQVQEVFGEQFGLDFRFVDATERFLEELKGVTDPEEKRIKIGHQFIEEFKTEANTLSNVKFLAQGTLYPDVIESISPFSGPSAKIKSHHNVGGLPEELGFDLIEPLRFLFKDEARKIGRELGLPEDIVARQPFPGPGLAVRMLGDITAERLVILRNADKIVQEEIAKFHGRHEIWQSFAVLLPVQTVGVQGDKRTYDNVCALRIVESTDGMTATWVYLPHEVLAKISSRICNEVQGINRVVLDVSSKPPSTIEWE